MSVLKYLHRRRLALNPPTLDTMFLLPCLEAIYGCDLQTSMNHGYPMSFDAKKSNLVVTTDKGCLYIIKSQDMSDPFFTAHFDACVFDAKFRSETQILSSTSDGTMCLMDINCVKPIFCQRVVTKGRVAEFVTQISFISENSLATISNSGDGRIWDLRTRAEHVLSIPTTKRLRKIMTTAMGAYRNQRKPKSICNLESCIGQRVIMALEGTPYVFTSGSCCTSVKQWDIRHLNINSEPFAETVGYESNVGFSSLAYDAHNNVYASCSDGSIHKYENTGAPRLRLLDSFKTPNLKPTPYAPIKISGNYLTSRHYDGKGCIWTVNQKQAPDEQRLNRAPSAILKTTEACFGVVSNPGTMEFYTCTDELYIQLWSLNRENVTEHRVIA